VKHEMGSRSRRRDGRCHARCHPCPRRGGWTLSTLLGAGGCGERPGTIEKRALGPRGRRGVSLRLLAGLGHGCPPRWPRLGPSPQHRRPPAASRRRHWPSAHPQEWLRRSQCEAFVRSPVTTVDGEAAVTRGQPTAALVAPDGVNPDEPPPYTGPPPTQQPQWRPPVYVEECRRAEFRAGFVEDWGVV
jgi:hypothetical protein